LERLGAKAIIFDKKTLLSEAIEVDFYMTEDHLGNNLNEKRRILRKRRDIMLYLRAKARQIVANKQSEVSS